jgi:hypothetical protein
MGRSKRDGAHDAEGHGGPAYKVEFTGPKRGKISLTEARPDTKASGLVGCVGLRLVSSHIWASPKVHCARHITTWHES